jgi:hypothetical protein
VGASSGIEAIISCASIVIIATNRSVLASTVSRVGITQISGASIAIATSNIGVLATNIGRN